MAKSLQDRSSVIFFFFVVLHNKFVHLPLTSEKRKEFLLIKWKLKW